jgi:hypothetical protein
VGRAAAVEQRQGSLAPLAAHAPGVHAALTQARYAAERGVGPELFALLRATVSAALGAPAAPSAPAPTDELDLRVFALAEQFAVYVPAVGPELVDPLRADDAPCDLRTLVEALYVVDQTCRLRLALGGLFDDHDPAVEPPAPPRAELRQALDVLHAEAMLLSSVDPLTTELVRLRCASYHDCKT